MAGEWWRPWRFVVKLDPADPLPADLPHLLGRSRPDAILVGGSDFVTPDNVLRAAEAVRGIGIPVALEVTAPGLALHGFDYYLIPTVLNARNPYFITVGHAEALRFVREGVPWERTTLAPYVIGNPSAKAASLTEISEPLAPDELEAYGRLVHSLWRLPFLYVEYSGTLAPTEHLASLRQAIPGLHVWYGGGVRSREDAARYATLCDTLVVGNLLGTPARTSLPDIAEAVRAARRQR